MSNSNDQYATFLSSRDDLSAMLKEGSEAFLTVNLTPWHQTCKDLDSRLSSERFRVMVLGEFKRGKSTFVNALLGREILPAFPTPCTAIINELKWGEEPRAVLHFKHPLPLKLPANLPAEVMRHLEKNRGKPAPPLPVAVEDLERYVVIPDRASEASKSPEETASESIAETPYEFAEVFWPLDLLRNSVEIIDSPGLNEHGSRTKVTMDYLGRTDAVVFLFAVPALASQSEISVIDHDLRAAGHEFLFFVCNRFDELRKPADRDRIVQYAYDQLAGRTAFGREGVFFVSALDAVIARQESRPDLLTRSGLPNLEKALAGFLVKERGRIKLLQPSRQLSRGVKTALFEVIPAQRRMLATTLEQLEQRYNDALPKLREASRRRDAVIQSLDRCRGRLREAVRESATNHLRELAASLPDWAMKVKVDVHINVLKMWAIEKQVELVAKKVVAGIAPKVEDATYRWQESCLKPLFQHQMADFDAEARAAVADFMVNIEDIRGQLAGAVRGNILPDAKVSAVERVLSTAGGLFLGGPGMALEGATMGYQAMLRSLIPNIMVIAAILLLNLNPITILPTLLALGVFRAFRHGDAMVDKIKVQVGKELANHVIATLPNQALKVADEAYDKTEVLVTAVQAGLNRELDTVKQQVEAVLEMKRSGADKVAKQQTALAESERRFQRIDSQLNEFILRLVQPKS
jgi:hypothetical protein